MITTTCFLFSSFALGGALAAATIEAELMHGKHRTDRTISLEVIVNAPRAEVFRLWTTPEGVKQFFAPAARIDPRAGGEYTILFAPEEDPRGDSHGTRGARILSFLPPEELAFEWIPFVSRTIAGKEGPPVAPPAVRNPSPLPSWVELEFNNVPGEPRKTHVLFAHYGFRTGQQWDESYRWFSRVWKGVLDQLVRNCEKDAGNRGDNS